MNKSEIKILIVDDDSLIAESMKMYLERNGYKNAITCCCFEDAVNAIENENIKIAFLDIDLDGIPLGIKLGEKINAELKIPIIFISANKALLNSEQVLSLNPQLIINKPIDLKSLAAYVETILKI